MIRIDKNKNKSGQKKQDYKEKEKSDHFLNYYYGAEGEIRTLKVLRPMVFETIVYAIPPLRRVPGF